MPKKIKPTKGSGYTEDKSIEAYNIRTPDNSAPSRETHKFLQYPDGGQMPIWYRHQSKNKEVVFRGHTDQKAEEIIVTLPAQSGTLAVYGEGGNIDLTDYATIVYSDAEDAKIRNEVINNHYTKEQTDSLIDSVNLNEDFSQLEDKVEANKNKSEENKKEINDLNLQVESIHAEQDEQDKLIEANKQQIAKNKTDVAKNTSDIEKIKNDINNTKDFFPYQLDESNDVGDTPKNGMFYASNGVSAVDEIKLTTKLHLSKLDQSDVSHHLEEFEKGDIIECFCDGNNPAQGFFEVQSAQQISEDYVIIDVLVIRSAGNWSDTLDSNGQKLDWKFDYKIGLEVDASNYYTKTQSDNLFTTKEEFDEHEKRNAASTVVLEAEILKVAEEVVLNYKDIEKNQEAIKANSARIDSIEGIKGEVVTSLRFEQGTWNVNTNVDAPVNVCKMHVDKTAMALNKDGLEGGYAIDWEKELEPYPSRIGFGIDGEIYSLNVEFTGKAGQNGRAYNFKILSHNLPDDIANNTTVSIYDRYTDNNFITVEESKEDDKALQDQIDEKASLTDLEEAIEDKASKSQENIFNGKQTFNKNLTFKGAETALIPTLSSRWHKISVNPPKNEDGTSNTDQAYGVNYYIDAGNSFKNQFKISNRNGTAFEVRGGEDLSGQLYKSWTYTGEQTKDDNIATVKYVNTAISDIEVPEPDLSNYMTTDETVDFVDSMDKLNLVMANTNARTYDQALKEDLEGQIADAPYLSNTGGQLDGALIIKKGTQVALDIVGDNDNSQIKFWSSGAVALQNYTAFKDNELVTKKYVDDKVGTGGSGGSGFTAGDQVAKTDGASTNIGGFWISNGNLYCKVN